MINREMNMSQALAERVLEKLGIRNFPEASGTGLAEIYQAWCQSVPFDNIRKRILTHNGSPQTLPGYTPSDFFLNWLEYGTGGTCWAGHSALYALLRYLGFPVRFGISTMLSTRPQLKESPGHGTVVVNFMDNLLIVDATMLHGYPLPLIEQHSRHPVWGTHVHYSEGYWCINWKPLGRPRVDCRLLDTNAPASEFPRRHELSRNNSHFDGATLIRLAGNESVTGIVKGEKVTRASDGSEFRLTLSHDEQQKLLIEHFHIAEEVVMMIPENEV